jgi:DNA-directed RNA polymerase omega subunit
MGCGNLNQTLNCLPRKDHMNETGAPASDNSKFRLILVIAQRARQLQAGAKPLVYTLATKATRIAREESRAGLLPFELITAATV